jgi:hypothetical protein
MEAQRSFPPSGYSFHITEIFTFINSEQNNFYPLTITNKMAVHIVEISVE